MDTRVLCTAAWRLAVLFGLSVTAGCGGGGGGGGSSASALAGIDPAYYPLDQGSQWSYRTTSPEALIPYLDLYRVAGAQTVSGTAALVLTEDAPDVLATPTSDYIAKDSQAYRELGTSNPSNWLSAALGPYDLMRFDGKFGAKPLVNKMGVSTGRDLDGDGRPESLDIRMDGTVVDFSSVTTDAGTFSSTAQIRYDLNGTLHTSQGLTLPFTGTITEWRAPGVGLIRTTSRISSGFKVGTSSSTLLGYRVNGQAAGNLPARVLAPAVGRPNSDATELGRHVIGSDGTNFLLVGMAQSPNPGLAPTSRWFGQIVSADGSSQSPFDLSPATTANSGESAVAFDGSNYLVVTRAGVRRIGFLNVNLALQRVSPSGGLVDAAPGISVAPDGVSPAIAYGSGVALIVYAKDIALPRGIYGRFFSGGVLGSEFAVFTGNGQSYHPSVAFDGANFLVAWEYEATAFTPSTADVLAARVSPSGAVLDASPIPVAAAPAAQHRPVIACDGRNCLVAWSDYRNSPSGDVFAAFIAPDGTLLNGPATAGGIQIAAGILQGSSDVALTFSAGQYILAWNNYGYFNPNPGTTYGIYGARIAPSGAIDLGSSSLGLMLSGHPAPAATLQYPVLGSSSSQAIVAWLNNVETATDMKSITGAFILPAASR